MRWLLLSARHPRLKFEDAWLLSNWEPVAVSDTMANNAVYVLYLPLYGRNLDISSKCYLTRNATALWNLIPT